MSTFIHITNRKTPASIALAFVFTAAIVSLGGLAIAPLVAIVFATGFVPGFLLWLFRPVRFTFSDIKAPYFVALAAYVVHRIDEGVSGFVPAMEELTGRAAVDVATPVSIILVLLSLIWMLSPILVRWGISFGYFGAWSLFAAFGIVEIWHFIFPLLTPEPYGYFPGMITAPLIAAAGWWGMWRLWKTE